MPDDDQVIAADLAHRLIRQRRFIYISPVLVLIWILQLVTRGFDLWSGILVASIALMCASVPYTLRDVRRAHTWLEKYSATWSRDAFPKMRFTRRANAPDVAVGRVGTLEMFAQLCGSAQILLVFES